VKKKGPSERRNPFYGEVGGGEGATGFPAEKRYEDGRIEENRHCSSVGVVRRGLEEEPPIPRFRRRRYSGQARGSMGHPSQKNKKRKRKKESAVKGKGVGKNHHNDPRYNKKEGP